MIDSKIHMSIYADDLAKSVKFYELLFNESPSKLKDDYARFSPDWPAVVFSIVSKKSEKKAEQKPSAFTGHFGIQIQTKGELAVYRERLEKNGYTLMEEDNTYCCYAAQQKFWVEDPDKNRWEVYRLLSEKPEEAKASTACC